ncbi:MULTISPECIES: IclR family transcriptional regulator [Actinopolyspora]|uniref:DNA-binding transcriptional regulator, IclR family n=1 Tax=Actinopolyspora saharensis TaxID=995062 RepID=A0A1H1E349_9ACTN|nr:IclR family transcriptional regulator [Actinopolyspora saharensis]SDQ83175.1 DNA-binding transcriptional regulator, IclR family [Actinopolyspora saharensis]
MTDPAERSEDNAKRGDMVGKALRVLNLLGEAPNGATLSELARRAGYPVSTTHRLLNSIAREQFAVIDEERRWHLGLRMFELGQRVLSARGFAGVTTPVLQRVSERTGEPTLMSFREGHEQLYVNHAEGSQQIQITGEPGKRGPLHCTAMGKCLIAFAPEETREQLVSELHLEKLGPRTITDRAAFRETIEQVRADGFAVADEEHEEGILAVGVPVLTPDGTVAASVSTAVPAFRSSLEELYTHLGPLRQAARELAAGLPSG